MNVRLLIPVLLAIASATSLSAKVLMRQTGWQTCGGGKIASDWAVYEVNVNGVEVLKGWLYEKCDGSSTWTPAQTSTQPLPNPDDGIEITTTPPPVFSQMQWGAYLSGSPALEQFAVASGELAEMELMDDTEANPGTGQHQQEVR